MDWVPAWKPKGHRLDSQSGDMPGLRAKSPVERGVWEATTHWCFSPSFSPSLPLSKSKINKILNMYNFFNFNSIFLDFVYFFLKRREGGSKRGRETLIGCLSHIPNCQPRQIFMILCQFPPLNRVWSFILLKSLISMYHCLLGYLTYLYFCLTCLPNLSTPLT